MYLWTDQRTERSNPVGVEDATTGHRLYVTVEGLHENGDSKYIPLCLDECGQASLLVQVDPSISVYQSVQIVLEKLTADYAYRHLQEYSDYLCVSYEFAEKHPTQCLKSPHRGPYMNLTEDHVARYLDAWDTEDDGTDVVGTLHGSINSMGTFIYDYPLVSRNVDPEYYQRTRGKCVYELPELLAYEAALAATILRGDRLPYWGLGYHPHVGKHDIRSSELWTIFDRSYIYDHVYPRLCEKKKDEMDRQIQAGDWRAIARYPVQVPF